MLVEKKNTPCDFMLCIAIATLLCGYNNLHNTLTEEKKVTLVLHDRKESTKTTWNMKRERRHTGTDVCVCNCCVSSYFLWNIKEFHENLNIYIIRIVFHGRLVQERAQKYMWGLAYILSKNNRWFKKFVLNLKSEKWVLYFTYKIYFKIHT